MENYPENGEQKIMETEFSRAYYRLLGQLEDLKKRAEDPNLPEEERKKAQADFKKWNVEIEKDLDALDAMDKKARAEKIGSQAFDASKISAEQIKQEPVGGETFIDSQGFVHNTPEEAMANEPDDWRKTS